MFVFILGMKGSKCKPWYLAVIKIFSGIAIRLQLENKFHASHADPVGTAHLV
eukprot:gene17992-biopygen17366